VMSPLMSWSTTLPVLLSVTLSLNMISLCRSPVVQSLQIAHGDGDFEHSLEHRCLRSGPEADWPADRRRAGASRPRWASAGQRKAPVSQTEARVKDCRSESLPQPAHRPGFSHLVIVARRLGSNKGVPLTSNRCTLPHVLNAHAGVAIVLAERFQITIGSGNCVAQSARIRSSILR
jgi:hypothetical protein